MSAITSTANGLWSAGGTWVGGVAPGIGDTATLAHNVTVDVNLSVGTSPNDTTTNVVTVNSAKTLTVGTGIAFTILGNVSMANTSIVTLNAGSSITFDNSGSGGSPVYKFTGAGLSTLNINGTALSPCVISAIVGQTFLPTSTYTAITATFATFRRCAATTQLSLNPGPLTVSDITLDACNSFKFRSTVAGISASITRLTQTNTVANGLNLEFSGALSGATRVMTGCVTDAPLTLTSAIGFNIHDNYFGGNVLEGVTAGRGNFRNNVVVSDSSSTPAADFERNYYAITLAAGNPHFLQPTAKNALNVTGSQNIFEGYSPDLIDTGDCFLVNGTAITAGLKIVGKNNIVIPLSYPGAVNSSGTMLTLFSASTSATVVEFYRNTGNVATSAVASDRGMFAIAEGATGFAGQVAKLLSNCAYALSAGQGFLGERVSGNVKDIITPGTSTANYNWAFNTGAGNNGRGYQDRGAGTFWTAGNAAAANVDNTQGTTDPAFYDKTRNIASWNLSRGYAGGSDFASGLTSLKADTSRIADLISYVFEGFRPGNSAMRNAAHDGGCVGAANYYKSTRNLTPVLQLAGLVPIGGIFPYYTSAGMTGRMLSMTGGMQAI
jgi:hypothetical protein